LAQGGAGGAASGQRGGQSRPARRAPFRAPAGAARRAWPPPGTTTGKNRQALSKSILYFEAQRSGRLPDGGQRVAWRANSGLLDGKANGVSCHDVRVGVALRAHGSKKSSNLVSFS
jgi:hypothetical protein